MIRRALYLSLASLCLIPAVYAVPTATKQPPTSKSAESSIFDFGLEPMSLGEGPKEEGKGTGEKPEAPVDPTPVKPPLQAQGPKTTGKEDPKRDPTIADAPKRVARASDTPAGKEAMNQTHVDRSGVISVDETLTMLLPGTEGKHFVITGDLYATKEPILYNTGGIIFHLRELGGKNRYELAINGMRAKRILLEGVMVPKFAWPMKFTQVTREEWHPFKIDVGLDNITADFQLEKGIAKGPLETGGTNTMIIGPGAKLRNFKVVILDK